MSDWFLYVLSCADHTLYTGITTSVSRRLAEHSSGGPKMAKYLRGRAPFDLVFHTKVGPKSKALSLERYFKALSRQRKRDLISDPWQWARFTQEHHAKNDKATP